MFKRNVGSIDRILRLVVGLGMITAYFLMENASPFLMFGVVPLYTAIVSSCPAYSLLGMRTCPLDANDDEG